MDKKPSIHFILPAGGVKGCFQFGFMYQLKKNFSHLFDIYQIDGTSVGALNGYSIITNSHEKMKKVWFSLKDREDLFSSWRIPIINKLVIGYNALYNNGIFAKDKLKKHIYDSNKCSIEMNKYNCAVCNLNTGETEYINGTNPNIEDFVLASSSPWIITEPVIIDNAAYIDGGLLDTYPIRDLKYSKADIIVFVGFDPHHDYISNGIGNNMLEYLAHLIDILRYQKHQHTKIDISDIYKSLNVVKIQTTVHTSNFLNFDPEIIQKGFQDGVVAANKFVVDYLPTFDKIKEFKTKTLKKSYSSDSLTLTFNTDKLV